MPHEILALKTQTVPPYTTTNAIFYGRKSFIVVDPGPSDTAAQEILRNRLKERLKAGHMVRGVYLTHHHGDHCGAAEMIRQNFQVKIYAHEKAALKLGFALDGVLKGGEDIKVDERSIKALYTPGHAESHLVYFDEQEGLLMAGDMLTDKGTVLIPPGSGSLKVYLESMELLAKLKVKTIIPAHGELIVEKAGAFILKAILHRLSRVKAILDYVEHHDRELDATEITLGIYGGALSDSMLFFSQLSVESSLVWLKEAGLVMKTPNHRWRLSADQGPKEELLLSVMAQLDQRLRDA